VTLCVLAGRLLHVFVEKQMERLCQLCPNPVLVIDVYLREERLIEPPSDLWPGGSVGRLAVLDKTQGIFKPGFDRLEAQGGSGEQPFSGA